MGKRIARASSQMSNTSSVDFEIIEQVQYSYLSEIRQIEREIGCRFYQLSRPLVSLGTSHRASRSGRLQDAERSRGSAHMLPTPRLELSAPIGRFRRSIIQ